MITNRSAVELAAAIRDGRLSAVAVIDAHIARIESVNPRINALASERFAAARAEAVAADAAPTSGRGSLHGVPVTVKDAFDLAGTVTSCGLHSRAGHIAAHDATLVARLRAAGAIVLGSTTTPDNCMAQETENLLQGRTNNPWNPRRSVAGSTGGEAALIAAGGSPLGIGSDIAGSIRLPAAFCGIVGLRATSDSLPAAGFWPNVSGRLADLNGLGPMARRVEDVALAYSVLRDETPHPLDPAVLAGMPVAYWLDDGIMPSSRALQAGVRAAVGALTQAGMRPQAGAPAARRMSTIGWAAYLRSAERELIRLGFGSGAAWSPVAELGRAMAGQPRVATKTLVYWLSEDYGSQLLNLLGVDGARWRDELRDQLLALIGPHGVAVCPVFPTTAPPHGWSWLALASSLSCYQTWVNLAGVPGLSLPVGFTRAGMPVGVQLVGAPGSEATLLAAGLAVQRALMPQWVGPARA